MALCSKEAVEIQELTNILSQIKFKQELSIETYIIILCVSGLGYGLHLTLKRKGKNLLTKMTLNSYKGCLNLTLQLLKRLRLNYRRKAGYHSKHG